MQEPGYNTPIPSPTGESFSTTTGIATANNSGMGATSTLPAELQGFNFGAFWFNWIWAIAHNSWIGLIALVPYVGFIMAIVLGFKGNEWAWQNRKWDSVEHFRATQRVWTKWAIILAIITAVLLVLVFVLTIIGSSVSQSFNRAAP